MDNNFKLAKTILKINNCCRKLNYWPKAWAVGKITPAVKEDSNLSLPKSWTNM